MANPTDKKFALCIDNSGYKASLITRKIYEILPDAQAAADDLIRVIDESGEDYLVLWDLMGSTEDMGGRQ